MTVAYAVASMNCARVRFATIGSVRRMDSIAWAITGASTRLIAAARPLAVLTRGSGRNQPASLGSLLAGIIEEGLTYGHTYGEDPIAFAERSLAVVLPMMDGYRGLTGVSIYPGSTTKFVLHPTLRGIDFIFEGEFVRNMRAQVNLARAVAHLKGPIAEEHAFYKCQLGECREPAVYVAQRGRQTWAVCAEHATSPGPKGLRHESLIPVNDWRANGDHRQPPDPAADLDRLGAALRGIASR